MKTMTFDVTTRVIVRIDETKFTPKLMAEFNDTISDYGLDEDAFELHGKRIAGLVATGIEYFDGQDFVEGYGVVSEAGINVTVEKGLDIDQVHGQAGAA